MKNYRFSARHFLAVCLTLLLCAQSGFAARPKYKTGEAVIKAMYERWQGKWYPNFQFEQRAIFYDKGQVSKEEVWQELYSQPGKLHIRFNGFESGNGIVFAQDSVYTFSDRALTARKAQVHPLVLLSFDVYFAKPAETNAKLQQLGFDLSKVSEATWQGRPAYVVGTQNPADGNSSQFWIDKERLYVVRVLMAKNGISRDVEINKYKLLENNWVATEIVFKTNGETTLVEEYFNMSFPKTTEASWFDPANFSETRWQ